MQTKGFNLVTCGHCSTLIIHRCDDNDNIDCHGCGQEMAKSDCPDYFYTGMPVEYLACEIDIKKAGEYLVCDNDEQIVEMIEAISKYHNQKELIDYVDSVQVWEKVELEFTCEKFLELIK